MWKKQTTSTKGQSLRKQLGNFYQRNRTMGLLRITALLVLCVSSCIATYGPHHHHHGKGSGGSRDIHLDSPNIHLDSPKIVVDRPRIHIQDSGHGHIGGDGGAIVVGGGGKSASILGVHSTPRAVAPIVINGGHGGYGVHGGYEGHGGKVLNVAGPVVVAPSPIVHHDGPILVRRPVTVHKELVPTQDHLERLHYNNHGGYIGGIQALNHGGYISGGHGGYIGGGHALGHGGYIGGGHALGHGGYIGGGHALGHGGYIGGHGYNHGGHAYNHGGHGYNHGGYIQALGKGVQDKGLVYERAPLTNLGHGLISFSAFHQVAAPVFVGQQRAIYGGAGHLHGGGLYGGGIAYGKDIHGGSIHGGDGGYKKY